MEPSVNNTCSGSIQQIISEMYKKMKAADTDGITGLSKKELASIDANDNIVGSAFLQALTEQFDKLDADKNGQLSQSDMETAISKQFSHPEIAGITNNNSGNFGSMLGKFSESFIQKLLSNYKSGDLKSLASSLSMVK